MIMNIRCSLHGTKTLEPAFVLLYAPSVHNLCLTLFHRIMVLVVLAIFALYDFAAVISLESLLSTGLMLLIVFR